MHPAVPRGGGELAEWMRGKCLDFGASKETGRWGQGRYVPRRHPVPRRSRRWPIARNTPGPGEYSGSDEFAATLRLCGGGALASFGSVSGGSSILNRTKNFIILPSVVIGA